MKTLPALCVMLAVIGANMTACATSHQITSGDTNMCVNVENHGYPVQGTPLRVKPCDPWRNQQWVFSNGAISGVGGMCLDVQGGMPNDGAPVVYEPCNGTPSQAWTVANGSVVGIGGKCLDIAGGQPSPWSSLVITSCTGSPSQQWIVH